MKKLLLAALSVVLFSCSSDSDSSGGGSGSGVAYIRGKLNGTAFNYTFNNTVDDDYLYNAGTGFSGEGFDRWYYYGGSMSRFDPPVFEPEFFIGWNNLFFGDGGDEAGETAAFYETVANLPTNYLTSVQDDAHMPGLDLQFHDTNDVFYNSKDGSQAGSTFTVQGSSEQMISGLKTKTIWGTFSCKLYDYNNPADVINVTDGTYKIILSEYN